MSLTLKNFNPKLLTLSDSQWDMPGGNGSITNLIYDGDRVPLIKLPESETRYGCQDYKGNGKFTITMNVDDTLKELIQPIESRLSELLKTEVRLINDDKLKVKMEKGFDGESDETSRIYDKEAQLLPDSPSSIPKNSKVTVALRMQSVFKNAGDKCFTQLFANQVKVIPTQKTIEQCVF